MTVRFLRLAPLALLAACSPAQLQTASTDAAKVQTALNQGCATYAQTAAIVNATPVGITPQAQTIEGFASGACVGAQATDILVQKALSDPTTQAWLANLSTELKAL